MTLTNKLDSFWLDSSGFRFHFCDWNVPSVNYKKKIQNLLYYVKLKTKPLGLT